MKRAASLLVIATLSALLCGCSDLTQSVLGSNTCSQLADEILSNEANKTTNHLVDINSVQDESEAPYGALNEGYKLIFACSGRAMDSNTNAFNVTFQKTENPDGKQFWQWQAQ